MKAKYYKILLIGLIIIVAITAVMLFESNKNEKVSVRIIIDDFGWFSLIEAPVIDDISINIDERRLVYSVEDWDFVWIRVLEVRSDTVVVELTLDGMYPKIKYTSEVDDKDFWYNETTTYIDEIPKNKCYGLRTCTADGGIVVYLIFEIEESEKHLRCGHGKLLVGWYDGSIISIAIAKDNRVKIGLDKLLEVIENPMTSEEILEYFNANDCGSCLQITMIDEEIEDIYGYKYLRYATQEEIDLIMKLYPELPYCK